MKSRTKKRLIALCSLVVVLAGVLAAYFILSNEPETESEPYVSPYTSLISEKSENITKLTYSVGGSEELTFTYADYRWTYTGDADFPVDNEKLNEMASAVSTLSAIREIEGGDNGEYGLGDGALRIKTEYAADGATKSYDFTVGDLNSYNSYTYIKTADGKVYMFTDSVKEKFPGSLNDLILLDDPEADVDTNYLVSLDVSDGKGKTNVVEDTAGMRAFLDQSDAYTCLDWVRYAMTDADFADYGIDAESARLTIRYKAGHSVTDADGNTTTIREEEAYEIIFGDKLTAPDENGEDAEYVYYTVTGSTILYKAPISDYEDTMAYLVYVPEQTETEADSPESAAQTEADAPESAAQTEEN